MPALPAENAPIDDAAQPLSKGKERLLEAAIELFGRDGFDGTSVRAVADRAGVSFALIRVAFGSKEGLRDAAEKMVFDEIFRLSTFTGFVSSSDEVIGFIRDQAEQFRQLKPKLAFIRRCILEQRPAANDYIRRMIDHLRENGIYRLNQQLPEDSWLQDPIRMIMIRLGYFLLSPNIEQLMGVDLMSMEEIERTNRGEVRLWQLIEAGLQFEAMQAKGKA
ncbi:TetR/AcrR family transcriptional regulator [Sphingopyxis macrogoltabida]|uniref:HTH tetR-type domain-containing protein n=1 Tax=Sphingopyxis macrogoltabida TaxID=33050 RepID=A0AAC9AY36_SPHMC|nr:TetR/AcrR family transcriptional regulator [Sphingopyxis macrogoltabida]ALJ15889.1 preprotein translocase subunit SecA [Sphingopyxis macrogoltabida]AMU92129.1 hypothetical protein ATM17_24240 [Sphingopyxis macrogoltabida]